MVTTMDRSVVRLPDPIAGAPDGERRRWVRQKLHTPVYASFNGPQTGMVVDLSELLDLHEDGFAVQTSERLEMNRAVALCLDLPETKSYIHGSGQVIWSDDTGRGGIRFSALPESSRQVLKEWLFANLLIACSNHAARTEQLARYPEEKSPELKPVTNAGSVVPMPDRSGTLPSVEAVRREVREIGDDLDAVLQLITERVLSLTGASGAALAFLTDDKMICRVHAGELAPPLGTPLDVKQGLSGECVRSGLLVSCEDMENDPRVDPEIGRALGIGSLMASPIVSDFWVVGLLEAFSPHAHSFTKAHGTVLDRLVEMIPKSHREKTPEDTEPEKSQLQTSVSPEEVSGESLPPVSESLSMELNSIQVMCEALWEQEPEAEEVSQQDAGQIVAEQVPEEVSEHVPERFRETPSTVPSRWLNFGLLGLAIAVVAMAVGYLVAPMIEKRWGDSPQVSQRSLAGAASKVSGQSATDRSTQAKSMVDLRRRADAGAADAQYQMGVRYHNGEDVPHDDAQAMQWFLRAAEQGNVDAQAHLGAYYWAGRGVPQDLSKAYVWSAIAFAQGDENSKSRLEGLSSQMTRVQVSAARQQAEAWIRTRSQP
jgi:GAF domain/Sel1 repeat/PilZ domain